MKVLVAVLILIAAARTQAFVDGAFTTWKNLTNECPDIVLVRCTEPAVMPQQGSIMSSWGVSSGVQIMWVLKGKTQPGPARVSFMFYPQKGEWFLLFSHFERDGSFWPPSDHRIIPLGIQSLTNGAYSPFNALDGGALDEQIKLLLRHRLADLNRDFENTAAEKKKYEEGYAVTNLARFASPAELSPLDEAGQQALLKFHLEYLGNKLQGISAETTRLQLGLKP